tara:strand:- start:1453 stop:3351 length:1899 start_codon:yes stop_codon:yes gene_type:complete
MSQQLLIDGSSADQTQFALIGENGLDDFEYESKLKKNQKGNIYLGKVSRIEASLQAAFVDIGNEKNAFLAFGEIHPNYFQIPVADRDALIAAEAEIEENHSNENDNKEFQNDEGQADQGNEINGNILGRDEEEINGNIAYNAEEDEGINGNIKETNQQDRIINKNKFKTRNKSSLKRKLYRSYKIQEVIKTGQLILVQVVKEERGNKGAALTSYISLAGKYSVLMPNSTKTKGISRKISTSDDRNKIKKIIDELNIPSEMGLIVRTAGLNKTKNEIKKDYTSLHKLWVNIVKDTEKAIAPALIHEEGNLLRRIVRDVYNKDMKTIYVEGAEAFKETKKYMSQIIPSYSKFVKQYKNKVPIFSKYGVEKEILRMFEPEVKLKSGGYIVINPTEALVSIDVNSGGATKERNIEKTALKTNIEAAQEISKQIKIRDLSGLIVIDFIDMYEMRNNRNVEKKVKELIKKDRARIQVSRISQFGLLEMSRQRLRQSFINWQSSLSIESCALKAIYTIKDYINNNKNKDIQIKMNPSVLNEVENIYKNELDEIKKNYKIDIMLKEDKSLESTNIDIINEKTKKKKKTLRNTKKSETKIKKNNTKSIKEKKQKKEKKLENEKVISPIKEIKNKKTGWWQT